MSVRCAMAALLGGSLLAGCGTPVVDYDPNASDGAEARDVAVDQGAPDPFVPECDPSAEDTGCPAEQFCETTARICVECVGTVERCNADGKRERCEHPQSEALGDLTGGFFEPSPCEPLHTCVPDGATSVSCERVVCTPGLTGCASPTTAETCNTYGTGYHTEACTSGWGCLVGECQ
ncbi:MAG: hypothetical protein QF464_12960, partial [Myxococcota bacterium]|nr:hypothetical protein [Myxococcota bacterium]